MGLVIFDAVLLWRLWAGLLPGVIVDVVDGPHKGNLIGIFQLPAGQQGGGILQKLVKLCPAVGSKGLLCLLQKLLAGVRSVVLQRWKQRCDRLPRARASLATTAVDWG